MKHTREDLRAWQMLGWKSKVSATQTRIIEWYKHYYGKVYISFSGGKDSTVLLDIARSIYPNIQAVFSDTGLEYPEVRDFALNIMKAIPVRPKFTFKQVIDNYGYPIISKDVAKTVYYYRKGSKWAVDRINGIGENEKQIKYRKRYLKYRDLLKAPFPISHRCCEFIKTQPLDRYGKETGSKPIIGTMACESQQREAGWLKTGCNSFENGKSQPMSFWTEQDVLQYLKITGIPYASVYGDIIPKNNQMSLFESDAEPLCTTGCDRTGCMFCCFGIKHDTMPNRFQQMKLTHPKLYDYCIGGGEYDIDGMLKPNNKGLGIGKILDYIEIPY